VRDAGRRTTLRDGAILGVTAPPVLAVDGEARSHRTVVSERDDVRNRGDPGVDDDLVTDRDDPDGFADVVDDARHVATWHVGQRRFGHRLRHPQIHVVEGARLHPHLHVVGAERRQIDLTVPVRSRRLVEDPRAHRTLLSLSVPPVQQIRA
jgi:hypothetical protein